MRGVLFTIGVALLPKVASAQVTDPEFIEATLRQTWAAIGEDLKLREVDKEALGAAKAWRSGEESPGPVRGENGRVVFTYGSTLPKVICTPLRVCDVELQPGERVNDVHVGDQGRWVLEYAMAGTAVHLVVKPLVANISTNVAVYTDRRVYQLELESSPDGEHTPFISFAYPEDRKKAWLSLHRQTFGEDVRGGQGGVAGEGVGEDAAAEVSANPESLFFAYKIKKAGRRRVRKRIDWAPERVYDDGEKTIIVLPRKVLARELPVLFVRDASGDNQMRAYSVKGRHFVVTGLFEHAVLVKGVGRSQQRVEIHREEE